MTDTDLMTFIVAIIADGISIAMCLSPVMQIVNFCKTKDINKVSELTFIVMTLNSVLWFSNFYRNPNFMAIFPHYFGIPLNLTFFSIFVVYKYRALISSFLVVASWGSIAGLMAVLIKVVPKNEAGDAGISMTAMIVNIGIAFSPMQKIPYVFKTGDYTVIPVFMNFVVILSSCIWGFYAVLLKNVPLLVPQIVIVAICLVTQGIYYVFKWKADKLPKSKTEPAAVPAESDSAKKLGAEPDASSAVGVIGAVRKQSMANEAAKGNLVIKIEGRN